MFKALNAAGIRWKQFRLFLKANEVRTRAQAVS